MKENLYTQTAWLYDYDNRENLHADIPFYIEYAKNQGGEVLELACGTGRVALNLAREGFNVTGLDLSNGMLDVFRKKLDGEPELKNKINLVYGNMAEFSLNKKFALIIVPFRAFQSLTDDKDILSALTCIRNHLADNGVFIINVFNPYTNLDESWCYPETVQWERHDKAAGVFIVKKHWGDKIDTENQIIYPHFAYEVTDKDGNSTRYLEDLKLKYYYENQLEDVLNKAGLAVKEKFGWYDKTSVKEIRRELIFVCGRDM